MKKGIICLCLALIGSTVFAQRKGLPELIQGILQYSPALKGQRNLIKMGQVRTQIQESYAKPVIGAEVGVTRLDPVSKASFAMGPGAPTVLQFQPNMNYNSQFVANHVLYDWKRNTMAIEKTRLETQLSEAQVAQQEFQLAYQIANLVQQIGYTRKAIAVQKIQLARLKEHLAVINKQVVLGEVIEFEQVSQQVKISNQESRIVELENQVARLVDYVSTLLGSDAEAYLGASLVPVAAVGSDPMNPDITSLKAQEEIT